MEESATCRACPAMQEPNHTSSVNYDDTHSMVPHFTAKHGLAHWEASEHIPLTLFNTLDPHSTDQAPASTAECLTMRDVPYRKAINTHSWAALAMPPDPALSLATAIHFAVEPKPAHQEPIKQTPHHPSAIYAKTNSPPEGFSNMNSSMAEDWHAILGHVSFINSSTIPFPLRWHKDIPFVTILGPIFHFLAPFHFPRHSLPTNPLSVTCHQVTWSQGVPHILLDCHVTLQAYWLLKTPLFAQ